MRVEESFIDLALKLLHFMVCDTPSTAALPQPYRDPSYTPTMTELFNCQNQM